MAEKLKDIKETASDAVEIMRELAKPEVRESLDKIKHTAGIAREIIESLKDPAMITNIENMRRMAESFESSSNRIEALTKDLRNSGVLEEAREAIKSARATINSVGDSKNMGETMDAIKEMLRAISGLVDELKLTVASSKNHGIIHNAEEAVRNTRSIVAAEGK